MFRYEGSTDKFNKLFATLHNNVLNILINFFLKAMCILKSDFILIIIF